jgi:hypothetical protein
VKFANRLLGSVVAIAVAAVLSGCTPATSGPTEIDLSKLDASSLLPTPKPGPVDGFDPDKPVTLDQAAMIALNTFIRFDQFGVVERQTNDQGQFVLVHNPKQKDKYGAAWFDMQTDDGVLLFDAYQFSSAWAYLVLSDPENRKNAYFQGSVGGFSIEFDDPNVGRFGYNYLTDGELMKGAWWAVNRNGVSRVYTIDYDFDVSDEWKQRLDELVEAEFEGREK